MKQTALKVALASAAGLAFSGPTLAWDTTTYTGTMPDEYHATMAAGRECINACPGSDSERFRYYFVANQSTMTPVVDTVTDCSSIDASGNPVNWSQVVNYVYSPSSGREGGSGGPLPATQAGCEIISDAEGKALSHQSWQYLAPAGPRPAAIFYLQYGPDTENVEVGVTGGTISGTPTMAALQAAVTPAVIQAGGNGVGAAFNTLPELSGWTSAQIVDFHYLTCDTVYGGAECGVGAKAVPVPAFAAGALALGLIATTYVSGRRRSIKKLS